MYLFCTILYVTHDYFTHSKSFFLLSLLTKFILLRSSIFSTLKSWRTLCPVFWIHWMMSIEIFLAQSHSWMPSYVHTGISLYKCIFLKAVRVRSLPNNYWIFLYGMLSCSVFFLTWGFQRSLASEVTLKYFALSA